MLKKYIELKNRLAELKNGDDEGAAMVEYGLLVAFIALIALAGVTVVGVDLDALFDNIASKF